MISNSLSLGFFLEGLITYPEVIVSPLIAFFFGGIEE